MEVGTLPAVIGMPLLSRLSSKTRSLPMMLATMDERISGERTPKKRRIKDSDLETRG